MCLCVCGLRVCVSARINVFMCVRVRCGYVCTLMYLCECMCVLCVRVLWVCVHMCLR